MNASLDNGTTMVASPDFSGPRPLLHIPHVLEIVILALMAVLVLLSIYYAIHLVRKENRLNPLYILIGGTLAVFFEPLGDLMAHVTFHAEQINAVDSYGFHVPLWMVAAYTIAAGVPIIWLLDMIHSGMTMTKWLTTYLLCVLGAMIFELPLIYMGAIQYYGPQPFTFMGYPVWMAFANASGLFFVPSTIIYFLTEKGVIDKSKAFLLVPLTPLIVAGSHVAGAFPHGFSMNSGNQNPVSINAFALLAMACCILLVSVAGLAVTQDRQRLAARS